MTYTLDAKQKYTTKVIKIIETAETSNNRYHYKPLRQKSQLKKKHSGTKLGTHKSGKKKN